MRMTIDGRARDASRALHAAAALRSRTQTSTRRRPVRRVVLAAAAAVVVVAVGVGAVIAFRNPTPVPVGGSGGARASTTSPPARPGVRVSVVLTATRLVSGQREPATLVIRNDTGAPVRSKFCVPSGESVLGQIGLASQPPSPQTARASTPTGGIVHGQCVGAEHDMAGVGITRVPFMLEATSGLCQLAPASQLHVPECLPGARPLAPGRYYLSVAWYGGDLPQPATTLQVVTTAPPPVAPVDTRIQVYGNCKKPSLEPTEIVLTCADYGTVFEGLHWTNWTATSATAVGTGVYTHCLPYCVEGHLDVPDVTITLTAPVRGAGGRLVWSQIQENPEPPGYETGPYHGGPQPLPTRPD
jgi:hypothetical protein